MTFFDKSTKPSPPTKDFDPTIVERKSIAGANASGIAKKWHRLAQFGNEWHIRLRYNKGKKMRGHPNLLGKGRKKGFFRVKNRTVF